MWGGMLREYRERGTGPPETSPDPGTVSECPARLTFSHITPFPSLFSWSFFFSSPLYPRVISLMMCNALKVLHQSDLLKWSMGNAPGSLFFTPLLSKSLAPSLRLSVSCSSPAIFSAVHLLSLASFLCICLLKLSHLIISMLSFPFSPPLFPSLSLSPTLWRLN